jgi:3-oxoacyl-[acyl-carrier protein] reductase
MTDALNETQVDQLKQQIPLGRMGQVGDIAAAVLYLASDQAGYVTGTTLHVNGGMWMG